ncbi:thiolase family protein [Corynebacterium imitans]|uniref:thiolase family protein n=1 Tax=Corynebacterium imitans TaxID=156978 RepID=UPI00254C013A|nr:thiolase family protein [Corynebacterium imitans]MDK8306708.1 thiolase family protein [Corynebacterium imitans]MDK8638175.1 thiolase family protein [Corynebacterium imitans]MDK8773183.1 thiolase family protein [Corynebacterium imitans]
MRNAVVVDVVRTAVGKGKPGGALSGTHPVDLLATVLTAIEQRNGLDPNKIDDVITGCVSQVGEQALNIGRQGVLAAGWPEAIPATTIDRQCGSSQQAVHFAAQGIMAGAYDIVVAAGVESMSRIPLGTSHMGQDVHGVRLPKRYPEGLVNQGVSAELICQKWGISREEIDEYSARSHRLAAEATESGYFDKEIVPVEVVDAEGNTHLHTVDETIRPTTSAEGLAGLKPSFSTDAMRERFPDIDWKITPGNSSPLTDGASAALIMEESVAAALGLTPRARFVSFSVVGSDPLLMLTGPIPATQQALERAGLSVDDIDRFEVNEAFAPVPLAWAREVGADLEKTNTVGGAIALGHALGSSGTRLFTTLINELERTGGRYGLQTMCEGAGMANATIIERL